MATHNTATSVANSGAFKGLKTPRELLNYNLMRGVTDFSNLKQWDLYEKGYPFLVVVSIPDFLKDLAARDDNVKTIVNNYVHILENDFRGIDNIDNITGESGGEISNGIRSIQLINKVTKASNSNFSLQYYERSGSILTKAHELYLTGIKDPDTQVKHYHGLIDDWVFKGIDGPNRSGSDPGPHRECFTFMYFITDNTMTKIERAFLIAACQPTTANYGDLYSGNKGDITFAEISLSFNGFFINNDYVYQKAEDMLLAMRNPKNLTDSRIIVDSNNFRYSAIAKAGVDAGNETDKFATPNYWSESEGRVVSSDDMKTVISDPTAAYVDSTDAPGTSNGKPTGDLDVYKNVVSSMQSKEHLTDDTYKTSGDNN
jgi:hypothetical protein|nr:MAG TPA: hypothetical protein [Caudoviricetes sp.]